MWLPEDFPRETLLFTIAHRETGRQHDVLFWRNYGIVCPGRFTTNGCYRYLTYCLMNTTYYDIIPGAIAPKSFDEWDLLDAMCSWLNVTYGRELPRLPHARIS